MKVTPKTDAKYKKERPSCFPYGVAFGRFQPMHLGHLEYLLEAKKHCDHLFIGITHPIIPDINDPNEDNHRNLPIHNPFTYIERLIMVRESLLEAGISRDKFEIVPFPINKAELIKEFILPRTQILISIAQPWRDKEEKFDRLVRNGWKYSVLFDISEDERKASASSIRQAILDNNNWESKVPSAVARIIKSNTFHERFHQLK